MITLTRCEKIAIGITSSIIIIVSVALISSSFQYVEWNQWALRKNTATNSVDYSKVYEPGRYFWGLTYQSVPFDKTIQTVYFYDDNSNGALIIFTDTGLEIQIECSFQYQLQESQLPNLFASYGDTYDQQVIAVARSALKNAAPSFEIEQYYTSRDIITANFTEVLAIALEQSALVDLVSFQLGNVLLADTLSDQLLNIQVQLQNNIEEQYIQEATLIRQYTNTLMAQIQANATQILAQGQSQANLIVSRANSTAFSIQEDARRDGLDQLYQNLNFTTSKQKLAFMYVTGLASTNARFLVDAGGASSYISLDVPV